MVLLGIVGAIAFAVERELFRLPFGLFITAIVASSLLAQRSLHRHVADVADALEAGGLGAGRHAVSMIVGRDPEQLDEAGVGRAAIESLAENFSDGIVAPLFWLAVLGLPGGIAYKAVNTADSMIGHKSDKYLAFGWASARFDDLVNLPASRLAALSLIAAAGFVPGGSPQRAGETVRRDARFHRSPNAGWPEAATAGALGLKLNGPRIYDGEIVDDPYMGDGRSEVAVADIRAALKLYRIACGLQIAVLAILLVLSLQS
jgi:adenosylcobinamide-phosphate synthase